MASGQVGKNNCYRKISGSLASWVPGSLRKFNQKGQMNFGFIIAVLLLIILVISASSNVLNLMPSVKREAKTASLEPRAFTISKLLLEDPGFPADWTTANVERIGLVNHDPYSNATIYGQLNSTKADYLNTRSYSTLAHQLGLGNETQFRLRMSNATVFLDKNNTLPSSSTSVFVLNRVFSMDGTAYVNVTLEVWE